MPAQHREELGQAIAHHFYREGREDQTHQAGHHIDAGLAQHARNRLRQ